MTRDQFITMMAGLIGELALDHEEHTGISGEENMSFESWVGEITSLYENTR